MNLVENIDGSDVATTKDLAGIVAEKLGKHSILWIKNIAPGAAATTYGSLADFLCKSKNASTTGWSDIKAMPEVGDYNRARGFHTDGAANIVPIDIVVMYCEKPAEEGGSTIFLDIVDLYKFLDSSNPILRTKIESTKILFEHKDKRRSSYILTREGERIKVNWDENKISTQNIEEKKDIALQFSLLLKEYEKMNQNPITVTLAPGEGIVWWDQSLLHARAPVISDTVTERFFRTTTIMIDNGNIF